MGEQHGGAVEAVTEPNEEFLSRIGHMTRTLHDSLRGLGLDKLIEKAAADIPDARDRLDYVARLSEDAAQKVLNATDAAGPLQDRISADARELSSSWQALLDGGSGEPQWRALAQQTIATLAATGSGTSTTKAHLMDIMMAQDFQDLTGQVIKKVTVIAQNLEQQLVQMLIDFAPEQMKKEIDNGLLNGPQIDPTGENVVADQGQVDDLLDSLGF
ncbi:protein phosphatase CheZ [Rugamonas sp.]|uniref:protein phosphatase CheZ n=1 Tax=Rugamonas sp. TaxID=1926287 RepID=UPI0025D5A4CE|nr:protein phosphatase CheZ [Rugamonas sp.]